MGEMLGWRCEACGAGESFMLGGGMMGFSNPGLAEQAKAGDFGPAMQRLWGDGIPEGWDVFRENAYYLCPDCGDLIEGSVFRIDDGSGGWLVFHVKPDACPSCGEELIFWDDKVPLCDCKIEERCRGFAVGGCPACGGTDVSLVNGCWD